MKAILFLRKPQLSIYTLSLGQGGRDEVRECLLDAKNPSADAAIKGMVALIDRAAKYGTHKLPSELFKCWRPRKRKGPLFCEFMKGRLRIGCFQFGKEKKLLLVSAFRKSKWKETAHYDRAVERYQEFCSDPHWEDRDDTE